MRVISLALVFLLLLPAPSALAADALGVVAPVLEEGRVLERPDPAGRAVPVVRQLQGGEIHAAVQREAREGFTARLLELDALARGLAAPSRREPTWLYLSPEDGGFARHGFWLLEEGGERYVDAPYIDLVVDEGSLTDGSFEEVFAHEMGHVFLRRLLPSLPAGYSRAPHHAFSLTDYPTAFDEGFAIHFQLLARRLTANARLRAIDHGFDTRPFLPWWLSNRDRGLRIQGVRANLFVQAQRPMQGVADALTAEQLSTEFDATRLRNGQQMLSSEGVIATLFHRWIGETPADGLVAAYRPWFEALAALQARPLQADSPLPVLLLRELHARDDAAGRQAIGIFIDTTYGATVDPALPRQAGELALAGATGDIEAYVGRLKPARDALAAARESALADPSRLDAALGPGLWLLAEGEDGIAVNLNSAEAAQLSALGLSEQAVSRLLESRRSGSAFADFDDVVLRTGLDARTASRLKAQATALESAGPYPRR